MCDYDTSSKQHIEAYDGETGLCAWPSFHLTEFILFPNIAVATNHFLVCNLFYVIYSIIYHFGVHLKLYLKREGCVFR